MSNRYRVYVSGPISGKPSGNEPAFREAAQKIERLIAADTVVPHDLYTPDSPCPCVVWCRAMVIDLDMLPKVDAIYFMLGWHESRGARRELFEANRLGLRLIFE